MSAKHTDIHCEAFACKFNKDNRCTADYIMIDETATRSLLGDIQTYRRCRSYEESEELYSMTEKLKKAFAENPQVFGKALDAVLDMYK